MRDRRGWVAPTVVGMFAVALGLVLGSGPLRTALIGSLGAQVNSLEDRVADAELAADRANVTNDYGDDWVDATATQLLGTTLTGHNVAFVLVDEPDADAVAGAQARVTQAGAEVAAAVSVDALWTDPNKSAFRAALAPQLAPMITGLDGDETVDEVFAQALAQSLLPELIPADGSATDPGDGGDGGGVSIGPAEDDRGAVLWKLLSDAGLVSGTRDGGADAVVIIAGEAPGTADESSLRATANLTLVGAFAQYDAALVAVNGPDTDGDLVSAVIEDTAVLASRVSTVTWIETAFSQVTVALALSEQFDGWVGHYGPAGEGEGDREAAPPPLEP